VRWITILAVLSCGCSIERSGLDPAGNVQNGDTIVMTPPSSCLASELGKACDSDDADLCADETTVCQNGKIVCQDSSKDLAERCDGQDNNCDGEVDNVEGTAAALCPCAIQYFEQRAYLFCGEIAQRTDWNTSRTACTDIGYHLVTVDNKAEDMWLNTSVEQYNNSEWWIGYTDEASEGVWLWADGSESRYTNWQAGEPNNDSGIANLPENCVGLNYNNHTGWTDLECSKSFSYVCESDGLSTTSAQ